MELLQTLRRIRACEGEAAAQLVLEAYVAQEVAAERERCARQIEDTQRRFPDDGLDGWLLAAEIRGA